jgi:cell division GTPase FtsZ
MATGGMGGGMDQINADVVLKAARRASASMGVFTG